MRLHVVHGANMLGRCGRPGGQRHLEGERCLKYHRQVEKTPILLGTAALVFCIVEYLTLRALAESARESRNGSRAQSLVPNDEDEELMRAIRLSEEEARAPKRARRDSTPEEERRMLAEYGAYNANQDSLTNSQGNGGLPG